MNSDGLKAYAVDVTWVHRYEEEIIVVAGDPLEAEAKALSLLELSRLGGEEFETVSMSDITDEEIGKEAIEDHVC